MAEIKEKKEEDFKYDIEKFRIAENINWMSPVTFVVDYVIEVDKNNDGVFSKIDIEIIPHNSGMISKIRIDPASSHDLLKLGTLFTKLGNKAEDIEQQYKELITV